MRRLPEKELARLRALSVLGVRFQRHVVRVLLAELGSAFETPPKQPGRATRAARLGELSARADVPGEKFDARDVGWLLDERDRRAGVAA